MDRLDKKNRCWHASCPSRISPFLPLRYFLHGTPHRGRMPLSFVTVRVQIVSVILPFLQAPVDFDYTDSFCICPDPVFRRSNVCPPFCRAPSKMRISGFSQKSRGLIAWENTQRSHTAYGSKISARFAHSWNFISKYTKFFTFVMKLCKKCKHRDIFFSASDL